MIEWLLLSPWQHSWCYWLQPVVSSPVDMVFSVVMGSSSMILIDVTWIFHAWVAIFWLITSQDHLTVQRNLPLEDTLMKGHLSLEDTLMKGHLSLEDTVMKGHLYLWDTCERNIYRWLWWDTSLQGTPLYMVPSNQGTPLDMVPSNQGTPLYVDHLSSGDASLYSAI